jgi:hypothetical protein
MKKAGCKSLPLCYGPIELNIALAYERASDIYEGV